MRRPSGSRSLGEFPLDVLRIECERCGRAGSYRRDGLMARFGTDIALPDLLVALSSCERRAVFSRPCGCSRWPLANGVNLYGKFS
jgi:hypothetical protein